MSIYILCLRKDVPVWGNFFAAAHTTPNSVEGAE